jgi:hypothetical protein
MPTAGYSGTPLAKKLGLAPGMRLLVRGAPPEYAAWIAPAPEGLVITARAAAPAAAHIFVTERADLEKQLKTLRPALLETGFVWISWPKKASKVPTTITEDVIRAVALPMGYVDVKVCAVSETWSGLKLVIRVSERGKR